MEKDCHTTEPRRFAVANDYDRSRISFIDNTGRRQSLMCPREMTETIQFNYNAHVMATDTYEFDVSRTGIIRRAYTKLKTLTVFDIKKRLYTMSQR